GGRLAASPSPSPEATRLRAIRSRTATLLRAIRPRSGTAASLVAPLRGSRASRPARPPARRPPPPPPPRSPPPPRFPSRTAGQGHVHRLQDVPSRQRWLAAGSGRPPTGPC